MNYFTSDWHLNEKRIFEFNPFFRPFKSIEEQNDVIINNCNSIVNENDTLYHLGDVSMDIEGLELLEKINCSHKILILGNYDNLQVDYQKYFSEIRENLNIDLSGNIIHLNHYPVKAKNIYFNLVGHIHGLWKVQKNMINVSCDAWHFKPVSEKEILFTMNAIKKHYDANVFPYYF